jgi:hypothetical protein
VYGAEAPRMATAVMAVSGQSPEPGVSKVCRRRVEGVPDGLFVIRRQDTPSTRLRMKTQGATAVTLRPCVGCRCRLTRVPPPGKLRPP